MKIQKYEKNPNPNPLNLKQQGMDQLGLLCSQLCSTHFVSMRWVETGRYHRSRGMNNPTSHMCVISVIVILCVCDRYQSSFTLVISQSIAKGPMTKNTCVSPQISFRFYRYFNFQDVSVLFKYPWILLGHSSPKHVVGCIFQH